MKIEIIKRTRIWDLQKLNHPKTKNYDRELIYPNKIIGKCGKFDKTKQYVYYESIIAKTNYDFLPDEENIKFINSKLVYLSNNFGLLPYSGQIKLTMNRFIYSQ